MARITKELDEQHPDHDWSGYEIDYLVEQAALKGIVIGTENERGREKCYTRPAVSWSGFWSQGDGLAFDATINWPVFFEAHPDFKEKELNWYLLLVSNPDYFTAGVHRYNSGNTMDAESDDKCYDIVEHGFFAGLEMEAGEGQMPPLDGQALEKYVLEACQDEAIDMYKSLEKTYEIECEFMKDQEIERLIEEHTDDLKELLLSLPAEFRLNEIESDDIDGVDLDELKLVRHKKGGVYCISEAGQEFLK